jgi:hypothetical protein
MNMAFGICRIVAINFVVLYVAALFLFLIGTFGWFGQDTDPLSGVFLVPLGLPWNRLLILDLPDAVLPWIGLAAPLLNLAILAALCRAVRGNRS